MNYDLKVIKDNYGEKMMHLCRELFPTLLEKEGLLSSLISKKFNASRFLYEDITENGLEYDFKNYIYSLIDVEKKETIETFKTPKELLDEAGYYFYECKTEEDIQNFKRYYEKDEELCTFNGGRLNRCYVFFVVKKDVDNIQRKNFKHPIRDDKYGTSVMSIQFTKGNVNTLSIKNRYNHTVNNPDATLSNNLENVIPGLTESFERKYNLHINQTETNGFEIPNYIRASDGKYYKYNYELNNVYYCPDNIIIDNFEVKKFPKERYIILDYFILDLKEKKIKTYQENLNDSFVDTLDRIDKINITKNKESSNKQIEIYTNKDNKIIVEMNKENRITEYKNKNLTELGDDFLRYNETLTNLYIPNVETIGEDCLMYNQELKILNIPKVKDIKNYFLQHNIGLEEISAQELVSAGSHFLYKNKGLKSVDFPNLEFTGDYFIYNNETIASINFPKLREVSRDFMQNNSDLVVTSFPSLKFVGNGFLSNNQKLKEIKAPKLLEINNDFLRQNKSLVKIDLPDVIGIGNNFISQNKIINYVNLPNAAHIGNSFLRSNELLLSIKLPELKKIGNSFLANNVNIMEAKFPCLEKIDYHFMYSSRNLTNFDFLKLNKDSQKLLASERGIPISNNEEILKDSIYEVPIVEAKKINIITKMINKIFKKDDKSLGGNHIK